MDTLAYLHLTETYTESEQSSLGINFYCRLLFQELKQVNPLRGNSILLILFAITLTTLSWATPAQALKRGNRGTQVTSLQQNLRAAGYYNGPVTGFYGSLTQAAVRRFQRAHGLSADGVYGPQTQRRLSSKLQGKRRSTSTSNNSSSSNRRRVLRRGSRGSSVSSLQRKLKLSGYYNGPITGYYGSLTQAAVGRFQSSRGLSPDGVAGPQTLSALESGSRSSASSPITPAKPEVTAPPPIFNNESFIEEQSKTDNNQDALSGSPNWMALKHTIYGKISPKSIVHSGQGLFFAQNMMYSHTITVYDRDYKLVKTIPDVVNLSKYGHSKFNGKYQGSPVEAGFSHNGRYAWVSNYKMYGPGFNKPGSDKCSPNQNTDNSFLYRIDTENLNIEEVIQVGSVPKFLAASPDSRLVLVSNWCSWDLSVVDTENNQEIKRIKLGRYPRGVTIDAASEKAYVALMGSYDIATINLKDFSVEWLRNIGRSPRHLNIDPESNYLYATLNGEGQVAKIDLSTGKVIKKVVTGSAPRSMALSDNGQLLYVVNYHSNTVSKVRTSDMKVLQTVNVNAHPIGVTYDAETRQVWVACYSGSIMVFQD
ncbi:MAG: peptidoglycan-binding protein [Symploca sp. SIO2B6]|nr:peptidoglycan-binding protein [Symploca sp. SIO2B6]